MAYDILKKFRNNSVLLIFFNEYMQLALIGQLRFTNSPVNELSHDQVVEYYMQKIRESTMEEVSQEQMNYIP